MKKRVYSQKKKKRFIINEAIRGDILRLIDENGVMVGNVSRSEALDKATSLGLDLVLIASDQQPPIVKILDLGKFTYEQERKERKNRAKSKETEIKEVRLSFNLSEHDRSLKLNRTKEFISEGHKVKIHLRLKGRENAYAAKAFEMINHFTASGELEFEQIPQKQGSVITALLRKKS